MHVYNAIIVLKEILPVFPIAAVNEHCGPALDMAIDKFLEKEERGDLKILGRAYGAAFKKRESIWSPPSRSAKVYVLLFKTSQMLSNFIPSRVL